MTAIGDLYCAIKNPRPTTVYKPPYSWNLRIHVLQKLRRNIFRCAPHVMPTLQSWPGPLGDAGCEAHGRAPESNRKLNPRRKDDGCCLFSLRRSPLLRTKFGGSIPAQNAMHFANTKLCRPVPPPSGYEEREIVERCRSLAMTMPAKTTG